MYDQLYSIIRTQIVFAGRVPTEAEVLEISNRVRAFIGAEVKAYMAQPPKPKKSQALARRT